jgi:cytochrome c551
MYSKFSILNSQCSILIVCVISIGIIASACSSKKGEDSSVKFEQYYVQGQDLYLKHCANCHQPDGAGLGLVFPPLNKSDFMDNNLEQVLCIMKYGLQGEITVNGNTYNQAMPGVPSLTDLEVAEIATYIYNSWEHKRGIVSVQEATSALAACKK